MLNDVFLRSMFSENFVSVNIFKGIIDLMFLLFIYIYWFFNIMSKFYIFKNTF